MTDTEAKPKIGEGREVIWAEEVAKILKENKARLVKAVNDRLAEKQAEAAKDQVK